MAKFCKHLKKGIKKLDKKVINNKKGLTLMQSFDITTSFYGKKKVKQPYITLTAHGNYRISVVKLTLLVLLGISMLAGMAVCLRALFARRHTKRHRPAEDDYDSYADESYEEEIPF